MIEVELSNGQIAEFPEGMSQEQMTTAIRNQFPSMNTVQSKQTDPFVNNASFSDLSSQDKAQSLDLARQQISQKYPGMPNWLRDAMLNITPKNASPNLDNIANKISEVTDYIPIMAGGLLEGASLPIRGAASVVPNAPMTKNLPDIPDITTLLPQPQNEYQKGAQSAAEFVGSLGPYGKLFGALKGATAAAKIPKALQNATALGGTGYIATPGDNEDKLLGAAGALTLGAGGKVAGKAAGKIAPFFRGLANNSTEQALIDAVQKPHDILSNTADQLYGYVKDKIGKRNISIPVKEEYLDKAKEILSKTRANKKLIDRAKSGEYDAVHDVQSHLWKKGTKATASGDIAKEKEGEEILDLRDIMNEDAQNHLAQTGNLDIAHALKQGRNVYQELKNTYYNKNLPKGIGKLVHSELRLIPEDPTKLFKQKSIPMDKFLQQHPDVSKHIQGITEKERAKKTLDTLLKSVGIGTAGTVGALSGKSIYDFLNE